MENRKALQKLNLIIDHLQASGIETETLIEDLTELRTFALQEKIPLVVKVLRLTCEHIEENGSFLIPIPDDEPIEDTVVETNPSHTEVNPIESLQYMLSLIKDQKNRMNLSDLKEYRNALLSFSN